MSGFGRGRWCAAVLLAGLALAACGNDSGGGSGSGDATPSREALVGHLRSLWAAIEGKRWDEAAGHLHFGKRAPKPEQYPAVFGGFVTKREISNAGIDILAAKGTFGPLAEVFAENERGKHWAERAGVPVEQCYALSYQGAEVAAYAGPDGLKLIRLDDVGKLK